MPLIKNFHVSFFKNRSDFGLATVVREALKVTGNGAAVKNTYILQNAPLPLVFTQTAILSAFFFFIQPV